MAKSTPSCLLLALFILSLSFPSSSAHGKPAVPPPAEPTPSVPPPAEPTPSQPPANYKGCFDKVYAFGDSYTDTGNAYLLGGLKSFIGAFLSHFPIPFGPLSHLGQQKGRMCNGRLVVDFLCESLSLPYLPPYKKASADFSAGANFAVAGSTSLSPEFFIKRLIARTLMWQSVPQGFQTQIDWYNKYTQNVDCKGMDEAECHAKMGKGLFWLGGMGITDYARTFGTSISARWLTERSIGHTCKIIEALLAKGAKHMVIQGLPPMGCLPICLLLSPPHDRDNLGCASGINSLITAHNDLLQRKLTAFQNRFPGTNILYADYYNAYRTILMNATTTFKFKEPFKACCGGGGLFNMKLNSMCGSSGTAACDDPGQHMIWDGMHLTENMHKHLTDLFLNRGFCKPSFAELVTKTKKL